MNVMDKIFAWLEGMPGRSNRSDANSPPPSCDSSSAIAEPPAVQSDNIPADATPAAPPTQYDDSEGPMDRYYDEIDDLSNRIDNDTVVKEKAYTAEVEYSTDSSETVSVPPERLGLVQKISEQVDEDDFTVLPEETKDNPNL